MSLINVINLKRNFEVFDKKKKSVEALKGVTFSIERGEIFGLLEPMVLVNQLL